MTKWARLALLVLLLTGVLGLIVYYDVTEDAHEPYPSPSEIGAEYDQYVGEKVLLWGTVQSTAPSTSEARISVMTATGPMTMTVEGFDAEVSPGGSVQVYGQLKPEQRVTATNIVVVNPAGSSTTYKYVSSALGALLVLIQFFRHWRVDIKSLAFEVRADG
jgi:hypothetical protein